jgi:uncharacterized protein YqgC (DUF456 family)
LNAFGFSSIAAGETQNDEVRSENNKRRMPQVTTPVCSLFSRSSFGVLTSDFFVLSSTMLYAVATMVWFAAAALVAVGIAGTVLPALPGPVLVFAGIFVAAWGDGFARIGAGSLTVFALLTAAAYAIDFVASALGVKLTGASPRAVIGAALGAVVGIFFGLPGLVLGPLLGALAAELTVKGDLRAASKAGLAAGIGFIVGVAAKLALVFLMIGLALLALFFA